MKWQQSIGATLVALTVFACGDREPINRVQPNYVDKASLAGEWYYQRTVVDTPAANATTFVGSYGSVQRIEWDVQEDWLFARRTLELIENGDLKTTEELETAGYDGEVVAAFKISKHFDIQRSYNTATGEEMNVLEENAIDRPWHERAYVRVDWSQNHATNYTWDLDRESMESIPYFVQEIDPDTGERHPDAPIFAEDNSYFDITTKFFAKAGSVYYPGYGEIPICWFDERMECGPGEYTIRNSFMKVTDRQYEPREYKGKETELFGYFWTDRLQYDTKEGIREQSRTRYMNRHHIWERDFNVSGTALPYESRTAKPIVYHVNRDWPSEADDPVINDAAKAAAVKWNDYYMEAVRAAGATPPADGQMFVLCNNNPVQTGDHPACGKPGLSPRIGDIRYSFVAYIPKYMTYGLLGLGPSNTDPASGEILSGMAYVYHHNDTAAFRTLEMIELLNGRLAPQEYIDGVNLESYVDSMSNPGLAPQRTFGLEEADYLIEKVSTGPHVEFWDGQRLEITEQDVAEQLENGVESWLRPRMEAFAERGPVRTHNVSESRLESMAGTWVEDLMVTDDMMMMMGFDPTVQRSDDVLDLVSPLRGGIVEFAKGREQLLHKYAEERTMYLPEMADDALIGLAREYANSNLSADEIYDRVRQSIYTAVIAHEIGHSLGLMHNFGGSDDVVNYHDEYWQIRSADGTVAPRTVDPMTDYERDSKLYNYAYSSVMDYAGRYTIDGSGPGKYDRAAIVYGYADKMEVFNDNAGMSSEDLREWHDTDGDVLRFYNIGPQAVHYTTYYNTMGDKLYSQDNREWVSTDRFLSNYAVTSDGRTRVPYIYCSHGRSDLSDSCLTRDSGADSMERMQNMLDDANTWYIMRSFPRGQVGSDSSWNYINRSYFRLYHRMKQWHDLYGLYKDFLPEFYNSTQLAEFFSNSQEGWGTKTWAIQNAFNFLMQTVFQPDAGPSYGVETRPDGTQVLSKYQGSNFSVDVVNGRYYSTDWSRGTGGQRDCGYFWYECLHHFGFYLDKIMAILVLSDSRTNFVARATPEDIREWEVSYYNTFGEQIRKVNTAILNGDYSNVGPYWNGSEVSFPNYAGEMADVNGSLVNPMATFTIQLYWQVLGQARFIGNFDQGFANQSQVFVVGTGDEPDLPASRIITYNDPFSGKTFGAIRQGGEGGAEQLLERANALLARSEHCDGGAVTARVDDDCTTPVSGHTRASTTAELMSQNELLESMALIRRRMYWGNPFSP